MAPLPDPARIRSAGSFVHMGDVQKTYGDHLLVFVVLLSLMVQVCLCGRRLLMLAEFASVQRAKTR